MLAGLIVHILGAEHKDTHLHILLTGVEQHVVLLQQGLTGLWLCKQHGIHLVVLKHFQTDVHIVNLYAEHALWSQLGTIHSYVAQHVGNRVAGHGQHLIVEMLKVSDTQLALTQHQPIGIGSSGISQGCALLYHLLGTHQVGNGTFGTTTNQGCINIHLGGISFQADVNGCIKHLVLLGHKHRQTIQCGHDGNLECSRILTPQLQTLLTREAFGFFVRLPASSEHYESYEC